MATRWRMPPDSSRGRRVGELGEAHDAEQLVDPLPAPRASAIRATSSPNSMLLGHRPPREQRVAPGRPCRGRRPGRSTRSPSTRTSPVVGLLEAADDRQQRRLAAARRAEQADELAVVDATSSTPSRATTVRRPLRYSSTDAAHRQLGRGDGRRRSACRRRQRRSRPGPRSDEPAQPAQEQVADEADDAEHDRAGRTSCRRPGSAGPARSGNARPSWAASSSATTSISQAAARLMRATSMMPGTRVAGGSPGAASSHAPGAERVRRVEQLAGHRPGDVGHHQDVEEDGADDDQRDLRALADARATAGTAA